MKAIKSIREFSKNTTRVFPHLIRDKEFPESESVRSGSLPQLLCCPQRSCGLPFYYSSCLFLQRVAGSSGSLLFFN